MLLPPCPKPAPRLNLYHLLDAVSLEWQLGPRHRSRTATGQEIESYELKDPPAGTIRSFERIGLENWTITWKDPWKETSQKMALPGHTVTKEIVSQINRWHFNRIVRDWGKKEVSREQLLMLADMLKNHNPGVFEQKVSQCLHRPIRMGITMSEVFALAPGHLIS